MQRLMNRAERVVESMIVEPLEWVREQGIVLQSARGPVPNLAEYVAGEPIRGSWWGHASGHEIFAVLSRVLNSPDVIATRLVNGKITLIHRRLWPALVRVANRFPRNAWLPSTRSTLPRAPTDHRDPFPEGSLPRNHRREAITVAARSHNAGLPPLIRRLDKPAMPRGRGRPGASGCGTRLGSTRVLLEGNRRQVAGVYEALRRR